MVFKCQKMKWDLSIIFNKKKSLPTFWFQSQNHIQLKYRIFGNFFFCKFLLLLGKIRDGRVYLMPNLV